MLGKGRQRKKTRPTAERHRSGRAQAGEELPPVQDVIRLTAGGTGHSRDVSVRVLGRCHDVSGSPEIPPRTLTPTGTANAPPAPNDQPSRPDLLEALRGPGCGPIRPERRSLPGPCHQATRTDALLNYLPGAGAAVRGSVSWTSFNRTTTRCAWLCNSLVSPGFKRSSKTLNSLSSYTILFLVGSTHSLGFANSG